MKLRLVTMAVAVSIGAAPAVAQDTEGASAADRRWKKRDRPNERKRPGKRARSMSPTTGAPGTMVTITGRGLARIKAVRVGATRVKPAARARGLLSFTLPNVASGPHEVVLIGRKREIPVGAFTVTAAAAEALDIENPTERSGDAIATPTYRRRFAKRTAVGGFWPRQGPAGTRVTIRGRNFSPATQVLYQGKPIADAQVTPRRIRATIPEAGGDRGLITLRTARGKSMIVGRFRVASIDAKTERETQRKARRERATKRWRERRAKLAQTRAERHKAMLARELELTRSRSERRRKRAAALRAEWKAAFLSDDNTRAELEVHAIRMARLLRMRRLASANGDDKIGVRIEIAIDKEQERHRLRMNTLKEHSGQPGGRP